MSQPAAGTGRRLIKSPLPNLHDGFYNFMTQRDIFLSCFESVSGLEAGWAGRWDCVHGRDFQHARQRRDTGDPHRKPVLSLCYLDLPIWVRRSLWDSRSVRLCCGFQPSITRSRGRTPDPGPRFPHLVVEAPSSPRFTLVAPFNQATPSPCLAWPRHYEPKLTGLTRACGVVGELSGNAKACHGEGVRVQPRNRTTLQQQPCIHEVLIPCLDASTTLSCLFCTLRLAFVD